MPLIIAGSIATLIVIVAVVTHEARADLSPEKQAAAASCESAYEAKFPDGPGIVGGDIYAATEWRETNAAMVKLGYLTKEEATLSGEEADAKNHEADALVASGGEQMTVLWQRDDQSHAQCIADMQGGKVTSTVITELVAPAASPSPSPSPSK